ncbi:MAG TPA: formate transporter [Cryomorphaceae bacterium]|nr:formate transporter [Owenweeksia sp.]HAD97108.1 formate transporter [Cryomorphaceae bacterium]HBF21901.1 formate transporter [Cryomorphaceae bacterium]|tara:strand:+ start:3973 stop:4767 length:795 start_codon:yes stop_codon:yes gene_type:complete
MGEKDEQKEHQEIIHEQIRSGFREYEKSNLGVILSAFTAGLEIGFSIFLMGVLYTLFHGRIHPDTLHLLVSLGYPLGFIFVIIGRSELFTEQTALAIVPVLNRKASVKELFSLWGLVLAGNLVGGILFSFFITWIGPAMGIISKEAFVEIAENMLNPEWEIIFGSAILAGWMMGLLGWLLSSSQESISRITIVIFITVIIGLGSLHHCIVGSVEVICGMIISDTISIWDYLNFLVFAVLGNTIGGAFFVSVLKNSQLKANNNTK